MGFGDKLRNELKKETANTIESRYMPDRDSAMEILEKGIRRIGYVEIDTLHRAGTCEGGQLSRLYDLESRDLNSFAEFLENEGFKVSKAWWGYSSDGNPDILKIRV